MALVPWCSGYLHYQDVLKSNKSQSGIKQWSFLFFPYFFSVLHCPLYTIWVTLQHSSWKSSTTHSYQRVQYLCVQTVAWLPVFGIFNVHRYWCMQGHMYRGHMGEISLGEISLVALGAWTCLTFMTGRVTLALMWYKEFPIFFFPL